MVAIALGAMLLMTGCFNFDSEPCIAERSLEDGDLVLPAALAGADELIWLSDGTQVFAIDPSTGASAVINDSYPLQLHSMSPDGTTLLATGECVVPNLFLLRADGGDLVQLTSRVDTYVPYGFSPDGNDILTWRDDLHFDGDVWKVDVATRDQQALTGEDLIADGRGTVGPDGVLLVGVSVESGRPSNFLLSLDVASEQQVDLFETPDYVRSAPSLWSDGTIVFDAGGLQARTAGRSTNPSTVEWPAPIPGGDLLHAPKHNRVAYPTSDGLAAVGARGEVLLELGADPAVRPLAWSPDGSQVLIELRTDAGVELAIVTVASGDVATLNMPIDGTTDTALPLTAVWAPAR